MDMAKSFSEDLRNMSGCFQQVYTEFSTDELPNYGIPMGHHRLYRGDIETMML